MFLAKTWLFEAKLGNIRDRLQMGDYFSLALFCKKKKKKAFKVDVESSSLNRIDVLINKGNDDIWRFMGLYGDPETQRRIKSWNLMRNLHGHFSVP